MEQKKVIIFMTELRVKSCELKTRKMKAELRVKNRNRRKPSI